MSSLAILVAAAAAGFAIFNWLKLPVIPVLVLLGFFLSHCGISAEPAVLEDLMALGLTFVIFSAGIELNPRRFATQLNAVIWTAALQFFALGLSGFALALLLKFDRVSAMYLGIALATSSTSVVIRQLHRRVGSLRTYGQLAIGVLLVQDLAVIVVIAVLVSLPGGSGSTLLELAAVGAIAGLAFVAQRWVFPWLVTRSKLDDEIVLLILLAVLFAFAGLANAWHLPFVVGAFFAGFSLSSFPVNGVARSLLSSLTSFFLAIFFTALGASVEIQNPEILLKALAFVFLVIFVTPPLVATIAEWKGGLSSRNAINCGLLLAQTSEFSLVLGLYALHLGLIPAEVMSVIAIVTVATMTITPLIASDRIARWLLRFHPLRRRLHTETDLRDHVLLLGFGTEGKWVIKPLVEAGHHVVVVDHDPAVVEILEKMGVSCIRGDASDEKILSRVGFSEAKLILISMPNVQESLRVLRCRRRREVPVIVRVFEEVDAQEIERHGGIAVINSHAAADTFMEWFKRSTKGKTSRETQDPLMLG